MKRWPPLLGGVLLNLALGAFYAWSVFVLPLEQAFGWSRQQTSWVFTIAVIATVAAFVLGGRMQDTRGPRLCGVIGATLVGLGFSLASLTTSLALLYTAFGCVVGVGNGIGYAAPMPMASKWFPDRRGLAVGLTVAGYGAGAALSGPLAAALIDQLGWRVTFRVLGLVLFAVGLTGAWLMKNPPPEFAVAGPVASRAAAGPGRRDVSTRAMVRTPTFYALWMAYCLGATAGLMTISQLVPFARGTGLSAMAATCALTVGAVGDGSGRVVSGWLSDTLGRVTTLRAAMLGAALAMPALLVWRTEVVPFYVLVAAVYGCYGTLMSVFASTTADFYGTRHLGCNYGVLCTSWGTAGVLGPLIGSRVFDATGEYAVAFYAASGMSIIACATLVFARPPARALADMAATVPRTAT
jgi:OFA family oxalate/formate antiporter-like MFS transporter